jgi:hypothetical protein
MVKAFTVVFKPTPSNLYSVGGYAYGMSGQISYPLKQDDTRPLLVIANNIKDVAEKYPTATWIQEEDVKDVVILDKVVCPVVK